MFIEQVPVGNLRNMKRKSKQAEDVKKLKDMLIYRLTKPQLPKNTELNQILNSHGNKIMI